MYIKLITSAVVAALLLTGTGYTVLNKPDQGAQLQQPAAETAPASVTPLTEEEAAAIALEHAGLTRAEAQRLHGEPDTHERIPHWDVEWRSGDWEYDYAIHMETGAVLEWEREYDPQKAAPPATEPAVPATEPAPQTTEPAVPQYLTGREALIIALAHANLSESQISLPETELDWDKGTPEWEVEFRQDGWEYSYGIHAETGKILEWEKDRDD